MAKTESISTTKQVIDSIFKKRSMDLQHDYQREVYFVAVLGLTIYYFLALFSFSPLDPSWVAKSYPKIAAQNLAGEIGAQISGSLIYFLGIGSFLLPLPFVMSSTLLLIKVEQTRANVRLFGWLMLILAIVSLSSSYISNIIFESYALPSGGIVGEILSDFLTNTLGKIGSNIILATGFICSIILIFKKGFISSSFTKLKEYVLALYTKPWFKKKENINNQMPQQFNDDRNISVSNDIGFINPIKDQSNLIEDEPQEWPGELSIEPSPLPTQTIEKGEKEVFKNLHSLFGKKKNNSNSPAYKTPPTELFNKSDKPKNGNVNRLELEKIAALLVETLKDFNVEGRVIGFQPGPVVTVYEFQPNNGIKQSKILGLIDDLALALKVDSIFINPVKGKRALGIQVPNEKREVVYLGDIIESPEFQKSDKPLTFALGKSLNGSPVCADLAATPHLLVAGATGSGKSVGINSLLCSILMKSSPEDVRMILVDPKMLELSVYDGIPHLLMPVITDAQKANLALKWAVNEMERRYKIMQHAKVRNIEAFNSHWDHLSSQGQDDLKLKVEDDDIDRLPYILLVIDELADLMLCAPKEIESIIQRLAQKARASGIHMVLATQRPSVDIITGVIKANLPTRIAFQVVSKHDSRTILDTNGADKLLGKGDMLFQRPGISYLERIQGTLITDDEVNNLVDSIKQTAEAAYDENMINWIEEEASRSDSDSSNMSDDIDGEEDPKYDEAFVLAQKQGSISASFLQRNLKIGYNRAARIVETMEKQHLVAKADGSKPRKWLGPNSIDQ